MAFLIAGAFTACERKVSEITFENGTAPVLTADRTVIPFAFATQNDVAVKLNWTNPEYQFSTGISSQDVAYQVEIDTAGSNFTNPLRKVIGLNNDLTLTLLQSELNDYLLNRLKLTVENPHEIEFRVLSSLKNNALVLSSNTLKYTLIPYKIPPKVNPPASSKLYITGAATPASWMAGGDAELVSQRFNQISPTLFELPSIALTGGAQYLLVPVYGNWDNKFGGVGADGANNPTGDEFKAGGGNLVAPAASGNYKITVDFQSGTFEVKKL